QRYVDKTFAADAVRAAEMHCEPSNRHGVRRLDLEGDRGRSGRCHDHGPTCLTFTAPPGAGLEGEPLVDHHGFVVGAGYDAHAAARGSHGDAALNGARDAVAACLGVDLYGPV